ncbi:MAG: hypothetical protein GY749_46970 [Desulfobacteraceae bacterium]|nr:hypothetical protein [Desulfobacteraceae bacterium]MCP4345508.1 hypothetical protein [Desulfobacterales bacterium]
MSHKDTDNLISEIIKIQRSDQEPGPHILNTLAETWKSNPLASRILKQFEEKTADSPLLLEDLLREKLSSDRELLELLNRIVFEKDIGEADDSKLSELSETEIDVLKALEQIGGGGSPIDIAVEGMLDIEQTRKTAERLWHKGLLLSHPLKDPDGKRFFSFSDLNKDLYKKLLEVSDAKLASKS